MLADELDRYKERSNKYMDECYIQAHPSRNYIPVVISSPNYTSLPSIAAIFLATHFMVVLQPLGYSIFHGGDTPIQLGLP